MAVHVGLTSTLFSAVFGPDSNTRTLHDVMQVVNELQILQKSSKTLDEWIGSINTALNSSKTRLEALCLLSSIVQQCSSDVFSQHCMSWLRILVQILQSHNTVKVLQLACSVVAQVLQEVTQFPEVSREVANTIIPSLMNSLIATQSKWQVSCLQLIAACIGCFPGPCGPFKTKLEGVIIPKLSTFNSDLSKAACECYPLLAQIGGGGNGGLKHTESWTVYFDQLLVSAHHTLGSLYEGLETEEYSLPSSEGISHPDIPDSEPSRTFILTRHFTVLSSCICNMLNEPFHAVARIPLSEVVSLCCRSFAVKPYMLAGRKSTEHSILMANLHILRRAALHIVSSLITCCHSNLIAHGYVINQLFLQGLVSSKSDVDRSKKPYSDLRSTLYTVLEKWIVELGTASGVVVHAEKFIEFILQDCTPPVHAIKLNLNESRGKQSKKRHKGRSSSSADQASTGQQKVNLIANNNVCEAGLKVLKVLLLTSGSQLNPIQHKEIHKFVLKLLLRVQQHVELLPVPYTCPKCRKELYHVLLAQIVAPHPRWPPSLHCAVQLFRSGRQDPHLLVSGFCLEASMTCTALMHPHVPSLGTSLPIAEVVGDKNHVEKQLSFPSASVSNDVLDVKLMAHSEPDIVLLEEVEDLEEVEVLGEVEVLAEVKDVNRDSDRSVRDDRKRTWREDGSTNGDRVTEEKRSRQSTIMQNVCSLDRYSPIDMKISIPGEQEGEELDAGNRHENSDDEVVVIEDDDSNEDDISEVKEINTVGNPVEKIHSECAPEQQIDVNQTEDNDHVTDMLSTFVDALPDD